MKETGIVRPVDSLGRVVIPIELRRNLGISPDDSLEIYVEGQSIVLKKHQPACVFCGETTGIKNVLGKPVCSKCIDEMKSI